MRFPILLALAFAATSGHAQDSLQIKKKDKLSIFGVKAGANLSNLFVDGVAGESAKIGYLFGIYIKLRLSDRVTFKPELNYTDNGAKLSYNNAVQGTGRYRFDLNYFQIPALVEVRINKVLTLHAGPYLSILSNVDVKRLDTNNGAVSSVTNLRTGDFNKYDYGVAGGIGFDIKKYTIGLRYNYGFNEVGKTGNVSETDTRNSRNCVANLYVAFGL